VAVIPHEHIAAVGAVNEVVPGAARNKVTLPRLVRGDFAGRKEVGHLAVIFAEEQVIAGPSRKQVRARTALEYIVACSSPVGVQDVAALAAHEPVIAALPGVDVVVSGQAVNKIIAGGIHGYVVRTGGTENRQAPAGKGWDVYQANAESIGFEIFKGDCSTAGKV